MTFLTGLKHAFAVDSGEADFTPEDMALLQKIAGGVVKRQLATPAIMFLESVRPLNFLGSQTLIFFQPIVDMIISTTEMERFSRILERRKSIPILIDLIEKADNERISTKAKAKKEVKK